MGSSVHREGFSEGLFIDAAEMGKQTAELIKEVDRDLAVVGAGVCELEILMQLEHELAEIRRIEEDIKLFSEGLRRSEDLRKG